MRLNSESKYRLNLICSLSLSSLLLTALTFIHIIYLDIHTQLSPPVVTQNDLQHYSPLILFLQQPGELGRSEGECLAQDYAACFHSLGRRFTP